MPLINYTKTRKWKLIRNKKKKRESKKNEPFLRPLVSNDDLWRVSAENEEGEEQELCQEWEASGIIVK